MEAKKPLVSFCIFSYNQEEFIREAIEGALAQTYSPLEIIISDDCSSDSTFSIIQETIQNYEGPHKIILNRNENNLGSVQHLEFVARNLTKGELIVVAAGDDISLSYRVETLYKVWEKMERKAYCISSDFIKFSELNKGPLVHIQHLNNPEIKFSVDNYSIYKFIRHLMGGSGCTFAYSPEIFKNFSPLTIDKIEDRNLAIRAKLLGKVVHVEEKLVLYRLGYGVVSSWQIHSNSSYYFWQWRGKMSPYVFDQVIRDIKETKINSLKKFFLKNVALNTKHFYKLLGKYLNTKRNRGLIIFSIIISCHPSLSKMFFYILKDIRK